LKPRQLRRRASERDLLGRLRSRPRRPRQAAARPRLPRTTLLTNRRGPVRDPAWASARPRADL